MFKPIGVGSLNTQCLLLNNNNKQQWKFAGTKQQLKAEI